MRYTKLLLALALILAADLCSFAQSATGTPPFSTITGGPFDEVNLANLNVHFSYPALHKAGRGLPFNYDISYDSLVWYPFFNGTNTTWTPVTGWGWRGVTEASAGYLSDHLSVITCPTGDFGAQFTNWQYHDPSGTVHSFTIGINNCVYPIQSSVVTTNDGSGYKLQVGIDNGGGQWGTIYTRSGTIVQPPFRFAADNATTTDRNGNQLTVATVSGTSTFTDTLGLTALTVSGTNPVILQYTGPNSATEQVKENYTTYTVKTNFGCSGVAEYGPTSISLISSITLPDNSSYQITYETTPGFPSYNTGRIKSVTLPTGGAINYTYQGANNGIICADGSTAGLTRQTPDGSWTYTRSQGSGKAWTTTVTDPQSEQTVINFQGNYETSRTVKDASANLLETVLTCYNGAAAPCDSTAVTLPISRRTVTTQLPNSAGRQSKSDTFLNGSGLPTEVDTYDWATGAVGSLLQKVLTTYASLGNQIADRPQTVTVQDGNATPHTLAQNTFTYDAGSVTGTTGTPQHVAVTGSRGNATTIARLVAGTTTLNTALTYYDTGTVNTVTDPNTAVTTYNYGTGSCGNSFVTSVSLPLSLTRSTAWDCNGGVVTSVTDENNQVLSYQYSDPFWRTTQVTDQTNVPTTVAYTPTSVESSLLFNANNSTVDMLATLDSLGRSHIGQKKQSVNVGANYDSVETDYDSLGRPDRATMPYAAAAGTTNSTAPATVAGYDALGRPTQITDGGSGTVTMSYSGNDVKRTLGPAPTTSRQLEYDALGRLISVCEITTAADKVACGQYSAANGYFTQYTYDTTTFSGNLVRRTTVTQNALSANTQTRTYLYDLLGRLISETNPEWGPGTTTLVYDSDATCGGTGYPTGNLVKRTDAMGNVTCYSYDQLHRQTDVTYPSGPYAATTAAKHFVYDSATVNNVSMTLVKGRLAEAYTGTAGSKITDLGFSYSARGEVTDTYQSSTNSGGYYHLNASYWEHGLVKKLMGVSPTSLAAYSASYGVEGEGRPSSVSAASGQNPVSSVTYNNGAQTTQPIGALTGVALGSGDSDTFSFDPNTGRFNKYTFTVNNQSVVGTLGWNTNGSLGSLQIVDPYNSADNQTCNYGYDDLGRVASANCGTAWNQTFSLDPFGNLKKTATVGTAFNPSYNLATNRYSSITGCTPALSYDANGNLQSDCANSYTWDAEGKPSTVNTLGITYDALGRAVEANGATHTQIVYGPQGTKVALMSGQNLTKSFVPLPGGGTAVYTSTGLAYYRHPDWLGSSRFASTPSAPTGKYFAVAYAPYGEDYADSGTKDLSFTGQNQDLVSGLYDFLYRKYNPVHGRWMSPDPAGQSAVDLTNPQSWNRYAYATNFPLRVVDPLGLEDDQSGGDSSGNSDTAPDLPDGGVIRVTVFMCPGPMCGTTLPDPLVFLPSTMGMTLDLRPAANNCTPLTPGCSNVPTAQHLKQFVQQQCLGQFNNSSLGGAVNFMSMASPVIGPNRLGSTIEDVGGTTLKYGVYQFFNTASQSMAGTPFGSMSGIVAKGIETIAKDVVLPIVVGATGLQIIGHAGCDATARQATGQMNPLPPGIQF